MRLYSCTVRLSGSLYNEVPKTDVTAAEIFIMRVLHGEDAVVQVYETGKNKATQTDERARLEEVYGNGLVAAQKARTPHEAISAVFGIAGQLPDDIPGAAKAPKPVAKVEAPAEADELESAEA